MGAAALAFTLNSCSEGEMDLSTESAYNLDHYQNGYIERIGDPERIQLGDELTIHIEDNISRTEFQSRAQVLNVEPIPDGTLIRLAGESVFGNPLGDIEYEMIVRDPSTTFANRLVSLRFDNPRITDNRILYLVRGNEQAGAVE